jgi:hypothetical protein
MAIRLFLTKFKVSSLGRKEIQGINLEDWLSFIESSPDLRRREKKIRGRNPETGVVIEVNSELGEADIKVKGRWLRFLKHEEGQLVGDYLPRMCNPHDEMRKGVVMVATHFGTEINHDGRGVSLNVWLA